MPRAAFSHLASVGRRATRPRSVPIGSGLASGNAEGCTGAIWAQAISHRVYCIRTSWGLGSRQSPVAADARHGPPPPFARGLAFRGGDDTQQRLVMPAQAGIHSICSSWQLTLTEPWLGIAFPRQLSYTMLWKVQVWPSHSPANCFYGLKTWPDS